jgi:hypothetical protein
MQKLTQHRWFYPLVYFLLLAIAFLPLFTERPYDPRNTGEVISSILLVSTQPYAAWGWVFHIATLAVIALAAWRPTFGGRIVAVYFGLNYWVVAAVQTHGVTEEYGFAVHTGALVASILLGLLWLSVAWRSRLHLSFRGVPRWRWLLLPFALLVFWAPLTVEGHRILPNFNPFLLLTSPDYGLAYCFVTPVFLFLLILAYPHVDEFALRVTAFNGLLYGLFNLSHWSDPNRLWMGVMHLPLLVMSVTALLLSHRIPARRQPQDLWRSHPL